MTSNKLIFDWSQPDRNASASEWAKHINLRWITGVTGIFEAGRLLNEAKGIFPHGEYTEFIETKLDFSPAVALMLRKIDDDKRLANPQIFKLLPVNYTTIFELTKLDDDQLQDALTEKLIRPDMKGREITQKTKAKKRIEREEKLAEKTIKEFPINKKYCVIVADPEWRFEPWSRQSGLDRAADNHYPTSSLQVIASRPVGQIAAPDSVLFLWATAPMTPHALVVMDAWGFEYKSQAIWAKDKIGTGYWFRNQHELLLVGTRGKIPAPSMGTQWSSVVDGAVGEHSAKPEVFLEMIEQYFPTLPKIELNRRGPARPGWDAWGNESEPAADHESPAVVEPAPSPPPGPSGAGSSFSEVIDIPEFLQRKGGANNVASSS